MNPAAEADISAQGTLPDPVQLQRLSFESSPIGQTVVGVDGTWLAVNDAFARMLGGEPADFIGRPYTEFSHPDERDADQDWYRKLVSGQVVKSSREKRYKRLDGSTVHVKLHVAVARDEMNRPLYFISQIEDLTESRAREAALSNAHTSLISAHLRSAALVEHSADLITITDADGLITYVSPASVSVLGRTPEEAVGVSIESMIHRDDGAHVWPVIGHLMAREGNVVRFTCRLHHAELGWRHVEITASNRMGDPAVMGVVSNVRDVTERVEVTTRLAHQAMHDPLTGLPNRMLFLDRLEQAIERCVEQHSRCGVLFVDLDRFKGINDSLGHVVGDRVLALVAERLRVALPAAHGAARIGGDEFVVLVEPVDDIAAARAVAERVREAVSKPAVIDGQSVTVGCSIGIAVHRPGQTSEVLLQEADIALYRAKQHGRNRAAVYDDGMRVVARRRLAAEQALRWALEHNGIEVVYQPIVELGSGRFVGVEALARVRRPNGSLLGAAEFIPVAEDTGLVVPLGRLVLRDACVAYRSWAAAGLPLERLALNVSAAQLFLPEFVEDLLTTLSSYGIEPGRVRLEITETTLIDAGSGALERLLMLKDAGVYLALDDFGTGWSSLAYVRRFPVDALKIDRSFVSGLGTNQSDLEVVKAITSLGSSLGLRLVAEGVETAAQEQLLIEAGCQYAQGFLYSPPLTAAEIFELPSCLPGCPPSTKA